MAGPEVKPRALLLDIEGTTTPISFVTETLFPFARKHGPGFIRNHLSDDEIHNALLALRAENDSERVAGAPKIQGNFEDILERTIDYYLWLIDVDRKSAPLKTIQGRIWEQGYARGELQSIVFPDVLPAFERWRRQGRIVSIYSSGSVLAQQQLFRHTTEGDLTSLVAAFFDTRVGAKRQAASYTTIAWNLAMPAGEILFVSDVIPELDAAHAAGMKTVLCVRPGNPVRPSERAITHPVIASFDQLP